MSVEEDVRLLVDKIKEFGSAQEDGRLGVQFGLLYEKTVDIFEALNGTLRAAKKLKLVEFQGQMLLKGANDNVIIFVVSSGEEGA